MFRFSVKTDVEAVSLVKYWRGLQRKVTFQLEPAAEEPYCVLLSVPANISRENSHRLLQMWVDVSTAFIAGFNAGGEAGG